LASFHLNQVCGDWFRNFMATKNNLLFIVKIHLRQITEKILMKKTLNQNCCSGQCYYLFVSQNYRILSPNTNFSLIFLGENISRIITLVPGSRQPGTWERKSPGPCTVWNGTELSSKSCPGDDHLFYLSKNLIPFHQWSNFQNFFSAENKMKILCFKTPWKAIFRGKNVQKFDPWGDWAGSDLFAAKSVTINCQFWRETEYIHFVTF
jgi:hypothetical protein